MFIDTHLHLVDKSRLSYPWLEGAGALDRDWSFEAYAKIARRIGIEAVLHMENDCAPADILAETEMIGEVAQRPGSLMVGAISGARPEDAGFDAFLDRLDRRIVKGVRRVLHVMPDDLSRDARFRANVGRLGAVGLPFDICVRTDQLDLARDLVRACEATEFVLDHCGVPDIVGGDMKDWRRGLDRLAVLPNVNAKISGISAYAGPDWTVEHLRPYVEQTIEAFGWDRVVWGSDSPVVTLNASLEQWMAATQALIASASAEERAKFASGNARRIWKL
ncbi:amidohydrolase [Salipiger sp. IMCC34102]|uniref:amidohydrolase family protein n=1 Tax=Salipiger sp. IMCC34102 TaxID=2510647 RepID=UPI00101BD22E|nr:amidohydrolase [Salipiger sp. IMCC34102]RYH04277.1 amidohydrolase [Salipiger sp. IMCC34102]